MKRTIDYPPIWLLVCLALAYALADLWRVSFGLFGAFVGAGLIGVGVIVMIAAVLRMRAHKTTIVPHEIPQQIVTDGVFRFSRNPIYLADAFTLAGFSLLYGSVVGLCLVPLFIWVIEVRFIRQEESRLETHFGDAYTAWAAKTRRWI